ncbi:hypothetical protein GCM10010319_34280 [Streptomyces blastmyceticus]|uniref:Uncharacterized protein n=1 Tax=Streptomyces blastmyceticus TaxID=68180 RepID=A0ABP3GTU3_9ACTN
MPATPAPEPATRELAARSGTRSGPPAPRAPPARPACGPTRLPAGRALLFADEMFRRSAEHIEDTLLTGRTGFDTAMSFLTSGVNESSTTC